MELLFVNRFYWPEIPATGQLLTDLAEGLAARGWQVSIITSAAHRETPRQEVRHGVRILRVAGTRWARHGTPGKAMDFATFYAAALWHIFRLAHRGLLVVPMTDPPLLGVGAWFAARLRGARTLHWIQDIYPEIAIELFGHRWLRLLRPLRNLAWRRAIGCVTLGSDMAEALHHAGVSPERQHLVPNWGPAGVTPLPRDPESPLRREWNLVGKFVVAYSGNLGRVHDLDPVIDLAHALRAEAGIRFIIIGDGAQRLALEAAARARALPNLTFHPPQPRERLRDSLAVGDLHLVTLRPGCEKFVFPSKLYGITAAGRPILFVGPPRCEVATEVVTQELGLAATRDDIAAMAQAVRTLAHDPAAYERQTAATLRFAAQHTAGVAVAHWHALLSAIAAPVSGGSTIGSPARV